MSALGSLVVKLGLEYAEYISALNKTEHAALATAKKVQDTFDGLERKIASVAGAIAGGLAAGFAVSAFKNLLSGVIETGARLDDLRMQTGETVEALSALLAVGKYNDVGADQLGAMMQKLSSNLAGATEESKGASKALQALGIDMEAFRRQSPAEQFQEIARKLADFEDGAGKSAVAIALLGKEGANALPFFNDLAAAGELQAKITTEQAAAAANLDDNLVRLSTTGDAWKKELVTGMVPALDLTAQSVLDVMNNTGGLRDQIRLLAADGTLSKWTRDAVTGFTYLIDVVQGLVGSAQIVGLAFKNVFLDVKGGVEAVVLGAAAIKNMKPGEAADIFSRFFDDASKRSQQFKVDMEELWNPRLKGEQIREQMIYNLASGMAAAGEAAEAAKPKLDFSNVVEKAGKAAAAAKNPVDALIESIDKRAAHLALELAAEEKLTEGEKAAIDVLEQLRSGKVKVTEAESALIGERLKSMLEQEKAVKRIAEEKQALEALRVERVKVTQGMEQSAAAVLQSNEELEREIELIGLTQAQQADVLRARNEAIILTKEATLAELERRDAITGTMSREQIALAQEIDGLKRRNELLGKKQAREEEFTAWQSMWQSIDQTAHDVFVNVFEDGAGTFKRLGQTLKAAVLDLLYQMTIKRWIISIGASVFGAGTAAAASAGGGALSTMGSAGGILSGVGAIGGAFAGGMGWLTGATTLGGALSAGGSLIAAGGAGVLPGMGMIGGALAPIAIGLGALYSLYSSLDRSGTPHYGAVAEYSGGAVTGTEEMFYTNAGVAGRYSQQAQPGINAVASSVGSLLDSVSSLFGGVGGFRVRTAYSDDSSEDPGFGSLRIERDGQKVVDWEDTRTSRWAARIFADGEEGWKMYLSAIAKDTRQALLDMDLPGWAEKMLTDLGDTVTMEQLAGVVQQIGVINAAFEQLGTSMSMFAGITDDLQGALLEAAGGIDALVSSAGAFYQGFYTEAERMESLRGQLNTALSGLDLSIDPNLGDDAKAQFRAAVESAMAAGNAELAASLLAMSGNFASAADYFEQLTKSAADAAKTAADAAKKAAEDADRARKDQINSAHDMFRRAVERDRSNLSDQASALGDVIAKISGSVDMLTGSARDLYGTVDSTAQMLAAQGMVYIEDALAGVHGGKSIADYTGLQDAVTAARAGLGSGAYVSEFDRQRDTLVLAGQLSELAEAGGEQLSVQERQLRAINEQIEYLDRLAQRADDMVNGTSALTGTVESYFGQLMSLLGVNGDVSTPSGYGGVQGDTAAPRWQYGQGYAGEPTRFGVEYDFGVGLGGRGWHDVTDREQIAKLTGLRAMLQAEYGSGSAEDLARVADKAKAMGATMGDIASALGFWREDIVKMFAGAGIQAFAAGGAFTNGVVSRPTTFDIGVMGERGSEAIMPLANIGGRLGVYAAGGQDTSRVEALLERLITRVERLEARVGEVGDNTRATAEVQDDVTAGGNATRTEIMNVAELAKAIAKEIA